MKQHQGVWLPDHEQHLLGWMTSSGELVDGRGTYQIKKLRAALERCRSFRTAVDVGAHVGMWTMQLAKRFAAVHSFEPVAEHRACFAANLSHDHDSLLGAMGIGADIGFVGREGASRVTLHPCALGDHAGNVRMETAPTSSGDTRIGGDGDIPLRTLDSFDLRDVDFIKLDCEGYELFALKGGEQTISRDLPTIIVEQKPGHAQHFGLGETEAVKWLQSLGYECAQKMSGDFVMVPQ